MRIPLFPLNTVLFPGSPLSLQIFEPRYREMIGECLASRTGFGVVLIRTGREVGGTAVPYDVGTYAEITHAQRLPDGRFHIEVTGRTRFRILARDTTSRSFQQADVEYLPDEEQDAGLAGEESRELFAQFVNLGLCVTGQYLGDIELPSDAAALAHRIAARLSMEMRDKQVLLEAEGPRTRLDLCTQALRQELSTLRRQAAAHYLQKYEGFGAGN